MESATNNGGGEVELALFDYQAKTKRENVR